MGFVIHWGGDARVGEAILKYPASKNTFTGTNEKTSMRGLW